MTRSTTEDTLPKQIRRIEQRLQALERGLKTMNPGSTFAAATTPGTVIGKVAITDTEGNVVGYAPVYDTIE